MLEAAIIGLWRSTPGLFSIRRGVRPLRRVNWRWRLGFTRKPPGGGRLRDVKYLDCSPEPGGFRVSRPQSASHYAWLRASRVGYRAGTKPIEAVVHRPDPIGAGSGHAPLAS